MTGIFNSLIVILFLSSILHILGKSSTPKINEKIKNKNKPNEATTSLNYDLLPPLEDVLSEIGLLDRLKNFVRMGVSETRILVLFKKMDFQMMVLYLYTFIYL